MNFKSFRWDGKVYTPEDFEEFWDSEFYADEISGTPELSGVKFPNSPVESRTVDCLRTVTVGKTHEGIFFLLWQEDHPDIGTVEDYFGANRSSEIDRSEENLEEWNHLRALLPPSFHFRPISRREAFVIVARGCIPEEFFRDLGLAPGQ